jgi:polyphosphate kinase 2 (PPK2 family)
METHHCHFLSTNYEELPWFCTEAEEEVKIRVVLVRCLFKKYIVIPCS